MRTRFLQNVLGSYGTQLVLLPLSLAGSALQARLVGPEGRGQLAMLLATVGISTLTMGLGLSSSIGFHVASGQVSLRALTRPLTRIFLGVLVVFVLLLWVLESTGKAGLIIGSLPTRAALPTLAALFGLSLASSWLTAVLTARKLFGRVNRAALFAGTLPLVTYGVILVLKPPEAPTSAFMPFVLGTVAAVELTRFIALAFAVRSLSDSPATRDAPLVTLLKYSLLAYACDTVQYLTYRADVWILQRTHGDAELGRYGLAVTLAELTLLAAGAFATVLFPYVPGLSRDQAIRTTIRVGGLTLGSTTLIAIVGFVLAIPLLPMIFTSAFTESVPLLGILLVGVVPMSLSKILGNYFAATGQMRVSLTAALAGMVVCISGDLLTIPRAGAVAAAVCTAVAYWVFTVILLGVFVKRSQLDWRTLVAATRAPLTHE